jgi:hypothetical protein
MSYNTQQHPHSSALQHVLKHGIFLHTCRGHESHQEEVVIQQGGLYAVHKALPVQQRAPVQDAQGRALGQLGHRYSSGIGTVLVSVSASVSVSVSVSVKEQWWMVVSVNGEQNESEKRIQPLWLTSIHSWPASSTAGPSLLMRSMRCNMARVTGFSAHTTHA